MSLWDRLPPEIQSYIHELIRAERFYQCMRDLERNVCQIRFGLMEIDGDYIPINLIEPPWWMPPNGTRIYHAVKEWYIACNVETVDEELGRKKRPPLPPTDLGNRLMRDGIKIKRK